MNEKKASLSSHVESSVELECDVNLELVWQVLLHGHHLIGSWSHFVNSVDESIAGNAGLELDGERAGQFGVLLKIIISMNLDGGPVHHIGQSFHDPVVAQLFAVGSLWHVDEEAHDTGSFIKAEVDHVFNLTQDESELTEVDACA